MLCARTRVAQQLSQRQQRPVHGFQRGHARQATLRLLKQPGM